jgi:hypothetical protein
MSTTRSPVHEQLVRLRLENYAQEMNARRQMIKECLALPAGTLNAWEKAFVVKMDSVSRPTPRQAELIQKIWRKHQSTGAQRRTASQNRP